MRCLNHFSLLYVSDLVSKAGPNAIGHIARQSRVNNRRDDITGLLVFDGSIFVQMLEGSQAALGNLLARLHNDPRHENIETLIFDKANSERQFPNWQLGYFFLDDAPDGISGLRGTRDAAALLSFGSLLGHLDLNAAEPSAF